MLRLRLRMLLRRLRLLRRLQLLRLRLLDGGKAHHLHQKAAHVTKLAPLHTRCPALTYSKSVF